MRTSIKWMLRAIVGLLATIGLCNVASIVLARRTTQRLRQAMVQAGRLTAERITIEAGPMWSPSYGHRPIPDEGLTVTNQTELASFYSCLIVQPSYVQLCCFECACGGDFKLTIHAPNRLPFVFTLHDGGGLRLPNTFGGDALLSPGAAYRLAMWLNQNGINYDKKWANKAWDAGCPETAPQHRR